MEIQIATRLKPFTRLTKAFCPLPGTLLGVEISPTKILIRNLYSKKEECLHLLWQQPVEEFQVQLNLERGWIEVYGRSNSYFSFRMFPKKQKIALEIRRGQIQFIEKGTYTKNDFLYLDWNEPCRSFEKQERLCLGVHKVQDVEKIRSRKDIREIFPIWLRLGQNLPDIEGDFLQDLKKMDRVAIEKKFSDLYGAYLTNMFAPFLVDLEERGFPPFENIDPFLLLKRGAEIIRSLFIQEKEEEVHLLPSLPLSLHSGRFINVRTSKGSLDIEWRKKLLRRMILRAEENGTIQLHLQKSIRTFRIRKNLQDSGKVFLRGSPVILEKNQIYFFDRFEK